MTDESARFGLTTVLQSGELQTMAASDCITASASAATCCGKPKLAGESTPLSNCPETYADCIAPLIIGQADGGTSARVQKGNQVFEELLAGGFRPLIEYRRGLPPTMTAEAIREAVLARAKETGFTIHALVPEKYREEVLASPVRDIAHLVVDGALANHESLTECVESDELPVLENAFTEGGAKTFVPRWGDVGIPVVVAWSTPFSNVGTVMKKMKDEHLRQFGRLFRMGPEARKEAAGYVRHFAEGKTNREIADLFLKREGFDLRAVDDAEYRRELRTRTDKVRQYRKRFVQYVTEIDEFQSRDSG